SAKAMTPLIDGLAVRGRLIVVGIDAEPIEVSPLQLITSSRSVAGHASGGSIDSQDTLAFSALSGVRPMIQTMPLARAAEACARMMRGDARLRMVLTMAWPNEAAGLPLALRCGSHIRRPRRGGTARRCGRSRGRPRSRRSGPRRAARSAGRYGRPASA